jgi:hypothetical protein
MENGRSSVGVGSGFKKLDEVKLDVVWFCFTDTTALCSSGSICLGIIITEPCE